MNRFFRAGLAAAGLLLPIAIASAHVTLDPQEAAIGWQMYQVRVPNERAVPTTQLRLVIPDGVEVHGVLPVPGWTHTEKDPSGKVIVPGEHAAETARIAEVVWSGGKINPGEYQIFGISTRGTGDARTLAWKAYQTYEGGEIVAWDDTKADQPAPKVALSTAAPKGAPATAGGEPVLWLSAAALALSAIAFMRSRRR